MKYMLYVVLFCSLIGCASELPKEAPIEKLFCEGSSMIGGTSWHVVYVWKRNGEFVQYNFEGYDRKWSKKEDFTCQDLPEGIE